MIKNRNSKKSPFPGMDPYLEQHWGDVHTRLMVYISDQINSQLPDELQARVEESTAIQIENESRKTVFPDLRVVEDGPTAGPNEGGVAVATKSVPTAQPVIIKMEAEPRTQRVVEIVDVSSDDRVVTAIEVLSPGNKIGIANRQSYKSKRDTYVDSGVNLVEIDLVREGRHIVAIPEQLVPPKYQGQHLACVSRPDTHSSLNCIRCRSANHCPTSAFRCDKLTTMWHCMCKL